MPICGCRRSRGTDHTRRRRKHRTRSLALAAVAPTVVRVPDAEAALVGNTADDETLSAVADAASEACDPIDDKRGTVAYRKQVAGVLAKRAVLIAIERAQQRNGTN